MPKPGGTDRDRLGRAGEALVARWLVQTGWEILAERWHCRWGELDLVARSPQFGLAFVEVKTRRQSGLDRGGRLAISASKQAKTIQAASLFLSEQPALADLAARFDVAIVTARPIGLGLPAQTGSIAIGQPVAIDGYAVALVDYLIAAYE